ncbi:hypothetical protein, partial [Allofournierella massiliensis]
VIPPFPHKTLQGKLLRGPRCRGKTNAPAEWTAFHSKTQANGWAFLILFRHSSFSPQNFARQIFAGASLPGENERPGRMDCIPFKNSGKWLGFSRIISSFLLIPTKLCKANFCEGPAAGGKRTPRQNGLHSIQKLRQMTGLFSYYFVIPPHPHKTLQGKFLREPYCRGEDELFFILFDYFHKP